MGLLKRVIDFFRREKRVNIVEPVYIDEVIDTEGLWAKEVENRLKEIYEGISNAAEGNPDAYSPDVVKLCRNYYYNDSYGHPIIENLKFYVIGKGIKFNISLEDSPEKESILDILKNNPEESSYNFSSEEEKANIEQQYREAVKYFWKQNRMEKRQKDIVKKLLRDGEVFLQFFENKGNGFSRVRFIDPLSVVSVNKDERDNELVKSYTIQVTDSEGNAEEKEIAAEDILHIRVFSDMDEDRGRPLLQVIAKDIKRYNSWLDARHILALIRSSFVLEKIMPNQPKEVTKPMPKPGTMLVHSDRIQYKFNNPNLQSGDAEKDGRLFRLRISGGLNTPEYMLGDASNANYASTLEAGSPFLKMIEDIQDTLKEDFELLIRKVIERYQNAGTLLQIPQSQIAVDIEFPSVEKRKILDETKAYDEQLAMGIVSKTTVAMKLGYDYEEELRKQVKEEKLLDRIQAELGHKD